MRSLLPGCPLVQAGQKFGRLTVIGFPFYTRTPKSSGGFYAREQQAVCQCECGKVCVAHNRKLRIGHTKSCGCYGAEARIESRLKHGDARVSRTTKLFRVWQRMRRRCKSPSVHNYRNYGGRGIYVCEEWNGSYQVFKTWAYENGYAEGLEIDRINNDGPYAPDNCRFVTRKVNARNRRNNIQIAAFGEQKTATDWVADHRCPVAYATTLTKRIRRGIPPELAITARHLQRYEKEITGSTPQKPALTPPVDVPDSNNLTAVGAGILTM